jgi:hypothetical protein
MLEFDLYGLESLVHYYSEKDPKGIVSEKLWEIIISQAVNGIHVPGDKFMADVVKDNIGLNIKTLKKKINKGNFQTLQFVQCRCPINDNIKISKGVIDTLVNKRKESFSQFNLDKMLDVIVIHNRVGEFYNIKLFVYRQPQYENLDLIWVNNYAYLNPDLSKKRWSNDWMIKRNPGDSVSHQTCVFVRKKFDFSDCLASITIKNNPLGYIDLDNAKKIYTDYTKN